jgi:hypothetical protein
LQSGPDADTGLIGGIIVTEQGMATNSTDLTPSDVDREFVTVFNIFDENLSNYFDQNIANFTSVPVNKTDPAFVDSNKKRTINGLLYGNVQGLTMNAGS